MGTAADSWLINRSTTQPGARFFDQSVGGFADQLEAMRDAESVDDMFERFEAAGIMLRIDPLTTPSMFHYATVSQGEIDQLRRIERVHREGRIATVGRHELVTQAGERISVEPDTLYIDCTATAVEFNAGDSRPVFEDGLITLQALRAPLVTFSAAIAAFVEAHFATDKEKNKLCGPVILADTPAEYVASLIGNMMNQKAWSQDREIREWLNNCRLNPLGSTVRDADPNNPEQMAILSRIRDSSIPAVTNLFTLMSSMRP